MQCTFQHQMKGVLKGHRSEDQLKLTYIFDEVSVEFDDVWMLDVSLDFNLVLELNVMILSRTRLDPLVRKMTFSDKLTKSYFQSH